MQLRERPGGWARLDGETVMVIGHQRGRDTKENLKRNFGMPHPEGYRKALRLMKLAEKFHVPVLTFIDTDVVSFSAEGLRISQVLPPRAAGAVFPFPGTKPRLEPLGRPQEAAQ